MIILPGLRAQADIDHSTFMKRGDPRAAGCSPTFPRLDEPRCVAMRLADYVEYLNRDP